MSRLGEAESILDKKDISVEDYKKFKEIGNSIEDDDIKYFAQLEEGFYLRLPEIVAKEGNWNWLLPEDSDYILPEDK
jgi:hypothetical protein|tara:strand:+ start:888 stop:1118 length:231 start_codon:yes stop_codon:yes gene_type:complete